MVKYTKYFDLTAKHLEKLPLAPNPVLTPGKYDVTVALPDILQPNVRRNRPTLTAAVKDRVVSGYKLVGVPSFLYVFDHLVPFSLGGTTDDRNIWPMPVIGLYSASMKDVLEDHVLTAIHHGNIGLQAARRRFADDWLEYFCEVIGNAYR